MKLVVGPVRRPGVHIFKRVTAIFESPVVASSHVEVVLGAEAGAESFIRNSMAATSVRVLPVGLLLFMRSR